MTKEEDERELCNLNSDGEQSAPLVLWNGQGEKMRFEQVALIPYESNKERTLYCILKPLGELGKRDSVEMAVFRIELDGEEPVLQLEENKERAIEIFLKYYEQLEKE